MSRRVPHFPLRQAARARPPKRLGMTSDSCSLHSLSIGAVAGVHQLKIVAWARRPRVPGAHREAVFDFT